MLFDGFLMTKVPIIVMTTQFIDISLVSFSHFRKSYLNYLHEFET